MRIPFPEAGLDVDPVRRHAGRAGGTEWQQQNLPEAQARPPRVDLGREKALIDLLVDLSDNELIRSAHDISNGGLAVALAECSVDGVGCHVDLMGHSDGIDATALLFGESQGRAIVSCSSEHMPEVLRRAKASRIRAQRIGHTQRAVFVIERRGTPLVRTTTPELARIWKSAFGLLLGGDSVEDVIRGVGEEAADVVGR